MYSAYTPDQISRFLTHIHLPPKYHPSTNPPLDISFLTALHTHTISTIPYENLSLHYSKDRKVSLDPTDLYQKLVLGGHGRGGYCMENSLFYLHILRGLGFTVYPAGVRIRLRQDGIPQGDYIGWVHVVLIVTLPDQSRWMIDVGFGGDGATKPVPLVEGHVVRNIGTQDIRLIRDLIPTQTDRSSEEKKMWIYQYRNGPEKEWNSFYAFPELEVLLNDFEIMNAYTSGPTSFQSWTVLVVLFLRRKKEGDIAGEESEEEIFGKRMLVNGVVKENVNGKTEAVEVCGSEKERVEALRKWFEIELTEEERMGIRGCVGELKG
jgi:arylamine N-acetyltransferase